MAAIYFTFGLIFVVMIRSIEASASVGLSFPTSIILCASFRKRSLCSSGGSCCFFFGITFRPRNQIERR